MNASFRVVDVFYTTVRIHVARAISIARNQGSFPSLLVLWLSCMVLDRYLKAFQISDKISYHKIALNIEAQGQYNLIAGVCFSAVFSKTPAKCHSGLDTLQISRKYFTLGNDMNL